MATNTEFIAQLTPPSIIPKEIHGTTICNPNCPHYIQSPFISESAPNPRCSLYDEKLVFAPMANSGILGLFSIPVDKCIKENFT